MKRNLFLVDSPLQALCAVEIALGKPNDRNDLVCGLSGTGRAQNNRQIKDICALRHWNKLINIDISKNKAKLKRFFDELKFLRCAQGQFKGQVDALYLGDFRSRWMHYCRACVNPASTFLIDDGASTLNIVTQYFSKGSYFPTEIMPRSYSFAKLVKKFAYASLIDTAQLKNPIEVVTSFELTKLDYQAAEKVTFERLRALLRNPVPADNIDVKRYAFYFGSKYSEAGIVTLDYELEFLRSVKNHYRLKGLEVHYYPHRDESREKLKLIRENLYFDVVPVEEIAELYLLRLPNFPAELASAYSSVLNSCAVLFPSVDKTCFRLRSDQINSSHRENVENVYSYYWHLGIPIIDPR